MTIHNAKAGHAGDYLVITPTQLSCPNCASTMIFWQVSTLNVTIAATSGHFTRGNSHFINATGAPTGQWGTRQFSSPTVRTNVIPSNLLPPTLTPSHDLHVGWNNVDPSDATPFCGMPYSAGSPVEHTQPWNAPWYDEVLCIAPTTGITYRFAHTFSTDASGRTYIKSPVGSPSQDGRFYVFSSDRQGTLGSENGGLSCITGGWVWKASTSYPLNKKINQGGLNAGLTSNNFKVTTPGTSGSTVLVWANAAVIGNTITDGTVVWTNIGPSTCRADIFVVELQ